MAKGIRTNRALSRLDLTGNVCGAKAVKQLKGSLEARDDAAVAAKRDARDAIAAADEAAARADKAMRAEQAAIEAAKVVFCLFAVSILYPPTDCPHLVC